MKWNYKKTAANLALDSVTTGNCKMKHSQKQAKK